MDAFVHAICAGLRIAWADAIRSGCDKYGVVSSAFRIVMLPSAVEEAIGLSESGTGNNHFPRRLRSRAAVPTSPSAPGELLSNPKPLLNCCSRATLVAPLKC